MSEAGPRNTHPYLDSDYWSHFIEEHYTAALKGAEELASYGADLLADLAADEISDLGDLLVIGVLYRQGLASFDGVRHCLRDGLIGVAATGARSLFEAEILLSYTLSSPDRTQLGRRYFVGTLRRQIEEGLSQVPGTIEHQDAVKAWGGSSSPFQVDDRFAARLGDHIESLQRRLHESDLSSVNDEYDLARGRRALDPEWYKVGEGSARNLFDVAKALGRTGEYQVLHRHLSRYVHGSDLWSHGGVGHGDTYHIEPVRGVREWTSLFRGAATWFSRAMRLLIAEYRAEHLPNFDAEFRRGWVERVGELPELRPERDRAGFVL